MQKFTFPDDFDNFSLKPFIIVVWWCPFYRQSFVSLSELSDCYFLIQKRLCKVSTFVFWGIHTVNLYMKRLFKFLIKLLDWSLLGIFMIRSLLISHLFHLFLMISEYSLYLILDSAFGTFDGSFHPYSEYKWDSIYIGVISVYWHDHKMDTIFFC